MSTESYNFTYAQRQKHKRTALFGFLSFLAVLLFLQGLLYYVIRPLHINSNSMQPEFVDNSLFFTAPLIKGTTIFSSNSSLQRGSLVTINNDSLVEKSGFESFIDFVLGMVSFQQLRPFETSRWGDSEVYRIVGMPGDTLYIQNYIAHIRQGGDSHFLTEFELSTIDYDVLSTDFPDGWNMDIGSQGNTEEITLKRGEFFLLCDNRTMAVDSRIFGIVHQNEMSSKILAQYYPFNSIRLFN